MLHWCKTPQFDIALYTVLSTYVIHQRSHNVLCKYSSRLHWLLCVMLSSTIPKRCAQTVKRDVWMGYHCPLLWSGDNTRNVLYSPSVFGTEHIVSSWTHTIPVHVMCIVYSSLYDRCWCMNQLVSMMFVQFCFKRLDWKMRDQLRHTSVNPTDLFLISNLTVSCASLAWFCRGRLWTLLKGKKGETIH